MITNGNDTASTGVTLEKLVEKAHKSEVLIYGIGILSKETYNKKAQRAVDALTKASGGASYYPGDLSEVGRPWPNRWPMTSAINTSSATHPLIKTSMEVFAPSR